MTLAAGLALAVPQLSAFLPPGVRPEDPRTELVVTGSLFARPMWQDGYRELWQVDPDQRIEAADPGAGPSAPDYGGRTKSVVALTSDTVTASGSVLAVSAATGRTEWLEYSQETCSGIVKGDWLRCQGGRMGYYPTELVGMASGDSRSIGSSQELGASIPDGQEDYYGWSTYVVDGVLFASWTTEPGMEAAPQHGNVARINDAGTGFTWKTEYPWHGADLNGRVRHGILTDRSFAVNVVTGEPLVELRDQTGLGPVEWVAEDVIQDGSGTTTAQPLAAPDGEAVTRIGRGGISITTQALPKHPLRHLDGRIEAFDPATGGDSLTGPNLWSTDVGFADSGHVSSASSGGVGTLAAYHDGLIAVVERATPDRQSVEVALLEEATGSVRWQASIGRPTPAGSFWEVLPTFTADGSLLLQAAVFGSEDEVHSLVGARLTMLDTNTSRTLWTRNGGVAGATYPTLSADQVGSAEPGWDSGAPFSTELETYRDVVVDNLDGTYSMIAPKPARVSAGGVPVGVPECPSGMTPVSWTQYPDGAILLCQQGEDFAVVFPAHPDWWANHLNLTADGYEVVFSNRARLRVTLGGALVHLEWDGKVSVHPATDVWNNTFGALSLAVPADLKACPPGSWPLSVSTYNGGWLLVCGTAASRPTSLFYWDGTTVAEATAVTYQAGGYCGTVGVGTVCAYWAPAVITVTSADGAVTQHSVATNYFNGYGQGGAGEGTGAYGVEAPDSNAKDQVRYLTQILQKSMTGRSNIDRAVAQVRRCTTLDDAITTMNSVTANREELLTALDSTPVDAVPNGGTLVAELRTALQLSRDSDLVWVRWAQSEQANGCSEGEENPLYRQVTQMNRDVSAAKDDFLSEWDAQIVPTYDAPRFKRSQI